MAKTKKIQGVEGRKEERDMIWRARRGAAELEAFKMFPRPMLERFAHMADHTRRAEVEAA